MATYTPHVWKTKETITASLLNHMEEGIRTANEEADKAQSAAELHAALGVLASETRAVLRELDKRLSALETQADATAGK